MRAERIGTLFLPKFETGELGNESFGEAALIYARLFRGSARTVLRNGKTLYTKDGKALLVTGSGKVNAAEGLATVLSDPRFDFSEAYIMSTGCCGGAFGRCIMGDVCLVAAAADMDLGHTADPAGTDGRTWYRDASYDGFSHILADRPLTETVYGAIKDIKPAFTEASKALMKRIYAEKYRDPEVIIGTSVTSDCFWKGEYGHERAEQTVREYGIPYPYTVTEMEDVAVMTVAERFGMLKRTVTLRAVVNLDVFVEGETPEALWGGGTAFNEDVMKNGPEVLDMFVPAMESLYMASSAVLETLNGKRL